MERATPPPVGRISVAWYTWWFLPLGLCGGTIVAVVAGPDGVRTPALAAGAVATVAAALCIRGLIRSQRELRRAANGFQANQAQQVQQWQQQAATRDRQWQEKLTALEERLAAERSAYEDRLKDSAKEQQERLEGQQALAARLSGELLPEAVQRLRAGDAVDDVLSVLSPDTKDAKSGRNAKGGKDQKGVKGAEESPEFRREMRRVMRAALISVEEELDRSTSAEQAVISIGSRIHVLTSKIRGRLHEMQGEHGRLPAVAAGLMELDQAIGPADCLAASIGVLGGSDRPGRQWQEPQRLLSVVRGGIGRIKDFDRVQVRHLPELGVDGGLVDHLTLVFAQLLDNAARYSPPTEPVVISGKEVPNGVGIEIQDAGKGLTEEKKQQAMQALEGVAAGPGLGGLSEDAHLGLRVVGILAKRYGIKVTFADSPWLGTSVVVVIPHKYFSPLPVTQPSGQTASLAGGAAGRPVGRTGSSAEDLLGSFPDTLSDAFPDALPDALSTGRDALSTGSVVPDVFTSDDRPSDSAGADTTPGGLPRRRSRRGEEASTTDGPQPAGPRARTASTAVPPDASFTGLAAFASAGRDTDEPREKEGN